MIEGVEWRRLFSLYEAAHQGISAMRTIQRSCVGGGSVVELTLMEQFKTDAERCRTPKQFRDLVKQLQDVLPYQSFISHGDMWRAIRSGSSTIIISQLITYAGGSPKAWL